MIIYRYNAKRRNVVAIPTLKLWTFLHFYWVDLICINISWRENVDELDNNTTTTTSINNKRALNIEHVYLKMIRKQHKMSHSRQAPHDKAQCIHLNRNTKQNKVHPKNNKATITASAITGLQLQQKATNLYKNNTKSLNFVAWSVRAVKSVMLVTVIGVRRRWKFSMAYRYACNCQN